MFCISEVGGADDIIWYEIRKQLPRPLPEKALIIIALRKELFWCVCFALAIEVCEELRILRREVETHDGFVYQFLN